MQRLGVPQDYGESVRWYRKAAGQGDAKSQNNLGLTYWIGRGVLHDAVQAYLWTNLAATGAMWDGREKSAKLRDEIARGMTPSQIEEAQRLARQWKPTAAKRQ